MAESTGASGYYNAVTWLRNQYARHKEIEDKHAADLIEAMLECYYLAAAGPQNEHTTLAVERVDRIAALFLEPSSADKPT